MTVRSPVTAIAKDAIAPSTSPISRARAVPIAWLAQPKAIPFAIAFLMPKILSNASPNTLPMIPVAMMQATVSVTMPPKLSLIPIPIGAVTDFGSNVTYIV